MPSAAPSSSRCFLFTMFRCPGGPDGSSSLAPLCSRTENSRCVAMRWQPPAVGTSALGSDKPGRQGNSAPGGSRLDGKRDHDRLVAELRFRLPAVEVRAPSILPGGTAPNGLASIAENSGMAGSGLAGRSSALPGCCGRPPAGIRSGSGSGPSLTIGGTRRNSDGKEGAVASRSVTVDLEDAQTGGTIATNTLAARDLDDAAARVAAYVARQIFKADPTAPPCRLAPSMAATLLPLCAQSSVVNLLIARRTLNVPDVGKLSSSKKRCAIVRGLVSPDMSLPCSTILRAVMRRRCGCMRLTGSSIPASSAAGTGSACPLK